MSGTPSTETHTTQRDMLTHASQQDQHPEAVQMPYRRPRSPTSARQRRDGHDPLRSVFTALLIIGLVMIGLAALLMATFARQGRDGEGRSASVGISPRAVRVEQTRNAQKAEITRLQDELAQARQDLATAIAINASLRSTPMPDRVSTVLQEPPLALILDAPVYEQQHTLSCESSAAAMAANFHGVGISEAAIIAALPRHDNPHLGFRGNIDGPYGGIVDYGVYAEPVRRVLAGWGLEAEHLVGGVNEIRAHIREGKVVIEETELWF